ncbi:MULTISPECIES: hypothetical protein [unclassified Pseudoalteromonas]|jgi:hypothetical protein|uniref:hypothetical protein n=1 Tax=unclassified Pseudoalteromonas TaxID=194690 RepID=UPI001601DDC7|nr:MULTISPECIES: hypothetical protein [unclassified Pseudoalteromonas]MBB1333891.1 hypothetical protein [Pseudoalteromonas sp. SR41-6]MBB1459612.1 hypothetical protein [Pseudoalteromonas sp. SG41-8]
MSELTHDEKRELAKQKQKLLDAKIDAFISDSDDDLVLLVSFLRRLETKRDKEVNGHSNAQFVALCRECITAVNTVT